MITIYADGGCSQIPGTGRGFGVWAYVVRQGDKSICEDVGWEPDTTNNRMEMLGCISALRTLADQQAVEVVSDSAYMLGGFGEGWFWNWEKEGFIDRNGKQRANKDLWLLLHSEVQRLGTITWTWTKGHATDDSEHTKWNNYVDGQIAIVRKANKKKKS